MHSELGFWHLLWAEKAFTRDKISRELVPVGIYTQAYIFLREFTRSVCVANFLRGLGVEGLPPVQGFRQDYKPSCYERVYTTSSEFGGLDGACSRRACLGHCALLVGASFGNSLERVAPVAYHPGRGGLPWTRPATMDEAGEADYPAREAWWRDTRDRGLAEPLGSQPAAPTLYWRTSASGWWWVPSIEKLYSTSLTSLLEKFGSALVIPW